jgi:hypothetical protein
MSDLKAELIHLLIDKYANAESEANVSFFRKLEAQAFISEDSTLRSKRLENFRKGIKETQSLARSLRKLYWQYLIILRNGRVSPEMIRDQFIAQEHRKRESMENVQKAIKENREAKKRRFKIVKSDEE